MADGDKPMPLVEFTANGAALFERVMRDQTAVVVENERGERAVFKPIRTRRIKRRAMTNADWDAFRAAAGSWRDVDTDQLLADIYASRDLPPRSPIQF